MADRFANGSTANDTGGLTGDRLAPASTPPTRAFITAATSRASDKLDYIKGLGTTAIWLTPSFKNRPVQGSRRRERGLPRLLDHRLHADRPALGHQRRDEGAHQQGARQGHEGLLRHHHQPHGRRHRLRQGSDDYRSKDAYPYEDAAGTAFDDRDYAGATTFPSSTPARPSRTPRLPHARRTRTVKVPAWLNDRRCTTTAATRPSPVSPATYGDFVGLDDLFTERPEVVDGMGEIYKTPGSTSASTASASTPSSTSTCSSGSVRAGHPRRTRQRSATTTSSCSARSTTATRR
jgi:hypothetical protein